jgi:hypothetical protein
MFKKALNILISILLLLPLLTEAIGFPQPIDSDPLSFQKPCDMDHCNPYMPKCPLCPSSSSVRPYLPNGTRIYAPTLTSTYAFDPISADTLSDQGYVTSVFRPPKSIF